MTEKARKAEKLDVVWKATTDYEGLKLRDKNSIMEGIDAKNKFPFQSAPRVL